jgi:galactose oxidase
VVSKPLVSLTQAAPGRLSLRCFIRTLHVARCRHGARLKAAAAPYRSQYLHIHGSASVHGRALETILKCPLPCAEIWDPLTEAWTDAAAMAVPRNYHSAAVLLKDGSIFAGGGGLCGARDFCDGGTANHPNGEVFRPPYLFSTDGQLATPPQVLVMGTEIANGGTAEVMSDVPLKIISIVRLSSATHSVNTDQRRIELCGPTSGACAGDPLTMYKVQIPADPGIALPGMWFLFGVNEGGVPGWATTIKIGS